MKTIKVTPVQFQEKVKLGYYEILNQISVFKFKVKHNLCGRTEELIIDLK